MKDTKIPKRAETVPKPKIHHPVIAAILLISGVLMLTLGVIFLPATLKSSSWPSTEGRITSYRLETGIRGKHIKSQYAIALDYKYRVGEKEYEGREFSHASSTIGSLHNSEQDAIHEYLHDPRYSKWQRGERVPVFYDPENPSEAVLKTGTSGYAWGVTIIGMAVIGVGIREFLIIRRLRASGNVRSAPSA